MASNLASYTALVTGGSSGMGFEMARQLLSQGATVIITARGGNKLYDAKAKLAEGGFDVHAIPMDVTSEESIAAAAKQVVEKFDHLDKVVNKAISFLASPASAGISGEKIIGKDIDAWLAERGIEFAF